MPFLNDMKALGIGILALTNDHLKVNALENSNTLTTVQYGSFEQPYDVTIEQLLLSNDENVHSSQMVNVESRSKDTHRQLQNLFDIAANNKANIVSLEDDDAHSKDDDFVFSRCNRAVHREKCTGWKEWIGTQDTSTTVKIPCGKCIQMDVADGRTYDLPNGLDVAGKLQFGKRSNVVIRTTAVFVQGIFEVEKPDKDTPIPNENQVKIIMTPTNKDIMFYPDPEGDNEFACGKETQGRNTVAKGCNVNKMPFVVAGGRLDVTAMDSSCPSFTRLAEVHGRRNNMIKLENEDALDCWAPGAEILLTSDSTAWDDHHVATIRQVDSRSGWIQLTEDLQKLKTSLKDDANMAVEVALLSRNFIIEADINQKRTQIGGHLMVMHTPGVRQRLEGILVKKFGQQGVKGRYPIHFHLNKDIDGSTVKKNVVWDSNQRCFVIHGTHNITIAENVAYNNFGHCFMLEDGGEFGNKFIKNLAAGSAKMPDDKLIGPDETDNDPANFWLANPENDMIGNIAAGAAGPGIWWELRDAVRGPTKSLVPSTTSPLFAPGGIIKDNIAHSNHGHGMTVYLNGWHPEKQTLWENPQAWKNGQSGVFYHATRNMKMVGGFFSDNSDCVRNHFADNIVIEDVTCVGESANMKSLVRAKRSESRCSDRKNYIGGLSFQPNEGENVGVVFKDIAFSGFAGTKCRESAALWMEAIFVHDKLFDNYQTFSGLTFRDETNKISACDSLAQGVRNTAIEDAEGTFSPTGKPGFYIQDEKHLTAFIDQDCKHVEASCMKFCEGACLRHISIETSASKIYENVTMIISNGKVSEVIPRSAFYWNGVFEENARSSFFDETKDWIQAWYGVAVPPGNYIVSFVDEYTNKPVWPGFVREVYDKQPACASNRDKFTISFKDHDPNRYGQCRNLIKNGDFEDGTPTGWQQHNTNFTMVSPGARDSMYALATTKRSEKGAPWYLSIGQSIDMSCLRDNPLRSYQVSGRFRLLDDKGEDVTCDRDLPLEQEGSCPGIQLSKRWWKDGKIQKRLPDYLGTLVGRGNGDWQYFEFEFDMPLDIADYNEVYLYIDGAPGREFLIDDFRMKLLPTFLESIQGTHWKQINGKGRLTPIENADEVATNRKNFKYLFRASNNQIVWRKCLSCEESHEDIYYRRHTVLPNSLDLVEYLESGWKSDGNCMGTDFSLYSTYADAINDVNRWEYCNFDNNDLGVGFPRECGKELITFNQWSLFGGKDNSTGQQDVAFLVEGAYEITEAPDPAPYHPPTESPRIKAPMNIAKGGKATMKCGSGAENGIDGKTNTVVETCSKGRGKAWWKLDFTKDKMVREIKLTAAPDDDLNVDVTVTNIKNKKVWSKNVKVDKSKSVTLSVGDGVIGRHIYISNRSNGALSFAEIEVNGHDKRRLSAKEWDDALAMNLDEGRHLKKNSKLTNLALNGFASQSSQYALLDANLAIDGNTNGVFSKGSVSSTACTGREQWWMVDLGAITQQVIDTIVIYNRRDCCSERLSNFDVQILDAKMKIVWKKTFGRVGPKTSIRAQKEGRYVKIYMRQTVCLQLAEVEVLGYYTKEPKLPKLTNLARNKEAKASQRCTIQGKEAKLAIDGRTDGNFAKGSVTSTCCDKKPFWEVDLGDGIESYVHTITIYNRDRPFGDRLGDFNVEVLDESRKTTYKFNNGGSMAEVKKFLVNNNKASRYVRISVERNMCLQLAEVEVMGYQKIGATRAPTPAFINLSEMGRAEQSCTLEGYTADLAIDGKNNYSFNRGSVSSTCCHEGDQWWMVSFPKGSENFIGEITIVNRDDNLGIRLTDFVIEILNEKDKVIWRHVQNFPNGEIRTYEVDYGILGSAVRIKMINRRCLQLAEVRIMGFVATSAAPTPSLVNLALNRPAFQVCEHLVGGGYPASLAVDGNTDGKLNRGSVMHTCKTQDPWWRVDLGELKTVASVEIFNRNDACCSLRMREFEVQIMDENTDIVEKKYFDGQVNDSMVFYFDQIPGRFVQIQIVGRDDMLHMAEVQVNGFDYSGARHSQCNVDDSSAVTK